jgi:hypothetical protein
MSRKMQKKEKRSMRGGDGAADFAKTVYGDAGQHHAGSQYGNVIAMGAPALSEPNTTPNPVVGGGKRFSKKQRGGDGAADFAKAVYGDVGQQHAGSQYGNVIATNNTSAQAHVPVPTQAPVANGAMKGGKKRNMLKRQFKIPAFLMYINPFSKSQKKGKPAKKRHGKTQKR